MAARIQAACGCNTGRIRRNNEDNFYFDGKCLPAENGGLPQPLTLDARLKSGLLLAVFDGMGGENFGEEAAFAAAEFLGQAKPTLAELLLPGEKYLNRLTQQLNGAVRSAQERLCTEKMGATLVGLYFRWPWVYACNVGDSRAYRLREEEFVQLSRDHVEKRPQRGNRKPPLTQCLGLGDGDFQIEPYIIKEELRPGDVYLLCSDGVTDMLADFEIGDILRTGSPEACVRALTEAALDRGGRDNITAIVCKIV